MRFYRLSEQRVRRVMHSPKRVEEGIAPKTMAMMQPVSVKRVTGQGSRGEQEKWTQEIWVMFQDEKSRRKVISAWRYPGKSKPRSEAATAFLRQEYQDYLSDEAEKS